MIRALGLLLLLILSACATPYQPTGFKGGYSDLKLDDNTFRVSFRGNGYTSADKVEIYTLYRCAELTVQRGFDYFVIVEKGGETRQSVYTTPGSYSSTTTFVGNSAFTSGTYSPGVTVPINRHRATVTIKTYRGEKPDIVGAYVARELMQNLRSQIDGLQGIESSN